MRALAALLSLCLLAGTVSALLPSHGFRLLAHRNSTARSLQTKTQPETYKFLTFYYNQTVDHFSFGSKPVKTFQQKVLVNVDNFGPSPFGGGNGPLFFYAGNEGEIETFAQNTGFMFDIAPKFKPLIVFAEHRYYGVSMPFGNESFSGDNARFLSSEQALADYAEIISHLGTFWDFLGTHGPVVVFGGSYGGMLAAWFRLKYPHIVAGAIASSAPIAQYQGLTDAYLFNKIITDDYALSGCADQIRTALAAMYTVWVNNDTASLAALSKGFNLCTPLQNSADVLALYNWVNTGLTYMAMTDYPDASSFLMPMPAWPVAASCAALKNVTNDDANHYAGLFAAVSVYYSYGQNPPCTNLTTDISPGISDEGWNYQACTEMLMPIGSNGVTDFFWNQPWVLDQQVAMCVSQYGLTPDPYWIPLQFGGRNISAGSNIFFANGALDPWSAGGVLSTLNPSMPAVLIADSAHHADLRVSSPNDPPSLIACRSQQVEFIEKVIQEATYSSLNHSSPNGYRAVFIICSIMALVAGVFAFTMWRRTPAHADTNPLLVNQ